ncbi:MAG: transcription antitermination factor NusB [Desulfovibrionaceae bacterium]
MGKLDKHIRSQSRRISYCIIRKAKQSAKPLQHVLSKNLIEYGEKETIDTARITEMVYGYFRYAIRLHSLLSLTIKKIKKIPEDMLQFLACVLYEIIYMESGQESSTIFTAVESIKKTYGIGLASLSNAVLRKIARDKEKYRSNICYENRESEAIQAQHYSLPLWIWEKLREQFGERSEEYASFFLNRPRKVTGYNESAVALLQAFKVELWEGSIWDCCSGRGGKSAILQSYNKDIAVMSDIYIRRLCYVGNTQSHKKICADASFPPFKESTFDIVVADVPCSGFGTLMKRPDIKIKRTEEDIVTLCEIQKKILYGVSPTIKRGGFLVYITCTWNREENEKQIAAFLHKHKNYILQQEYNSPLEYNDILYGAILRKE